MFNFLKFELKKSCFKNCSMRDYVWILREENDKKKKYIHKQLKLDLALIEEDKQNYLSKQNKYKLRDICIFFSSSTCLKRERER